jgi:hypothetical protein
VEIMGSQKCRIVGKSRSVLIRINAWPGGRVAGMQKRGVGALEPSVLVEMLPLAAKIGAQVHSLLQGCMQQPVAAAAGPDVSRE